MPSSGLIIFIVASNPLCLDHLLEKSVIVVAIYGLILAELVPLLGNHFVRDLVLLCATYQHRWK